jgi:hypothetical protein
LLARDALTNGKILSVVAADPATRALAASAGLPVFSSVGEYESSLPAGRATAAGSAGAAAGGAAAGRDPGAAAGAADDEPILISETVATPAPRPSARRPGSPRARGDAPAALTGAAGAAATAASAATIGAVEAGGSTAAATGGAAAAAAAVGAATSPLTEPSAASIPAEPRRAARTPASIPAARVVADTPAAERDRLPSSGPEPAERALRPSVGRTPIAIGLGVLALAIVIAGAGAFLFLPTATATISPREKSVGPISLRIVASTSATAPDPDATPPVVPAELITIPLEASDTFPATGKRIEETKATGTVRFDNLDPTSSNTIEKGSIVSTGSGIRFRTDKEVKIKAAKLVGFQIIPSSASVDVTAVDAGTDGNVEPNTIKTEPRGENPAFLDVTNPEATTGGTHTEFQRIKQEDVDAATKALTDSLTASFEDRLDDPDLPGGAATVFPETKVLGAPVFGVDPKSLVGKEVETFDLAATASGTVVAVDTAPVQTIAETRLASSIEPGYALIEGSGQVDPAPAEISDGIITFPVVVTAREVLVLDAERIKAEIMGKPLADAREILATYGDAELTLWPDWVGTVPTLDSRVEVTVTGHATP